MAQQTPVLPPGWTAQWDPQAGRTVYVEASTGRSSWQPPAPPGGRPSHPQGAARMSMPPMQGPPGMRPPMDSPGFAGGDSSASPALSPAAPGIQTSKRRAYPTAHLASNSVSYSGGFDPGAQQAGGGYGGPGSVASPMAPIAETQGQYFTPGAPEMTAPTGYQGGQAPGAPYGNGQAGAGYQAGAGAGGMGGLANQFANMGVGAGMGKGNHSTLST